MAQKQVSSDLRGELPPLLRLAGPVVAAEVGWMAMGIVDTLMVGRVSPTALAAVAFGGNLFLAVTIFGIGMLLGLDYLVSHAYGGGRIGEANRSLVQGIYLALALSAVLMTLIFVGMGRIDRLGVDHEVVVQTVPFLRALTIGMPALLLFVALRRYLQAVGLVKPIMVALVTANLLNLVLDWALVFGHLGFRAMGAEGAGWATCIGRMYLLAYAVIVLLIREKRNRTGLLETSRRIDGVRFKQLVSLGFPAALQITLEVGVFAVSTILVGRLGVIPLGAHQIAIVLVSFTFMVPLGISSAGAVRVGQALGSGDPAAAARSGWAALVAGVSFMVLSAIVFASIPELVMKAFTNDALVISLGVRLLRVAAIFQLFDGVQVVATGILRGTGDTRKPMIANFIGHWILGLPTGYYLCFGRGRGVVGLWGGLCVGLMVVAVLLLFVWARKARKLKSSPSLSTPVDASA